MPYILLTLSVFMNASASIFGKMYNRQVVHQKGSDTLYNLVQLVTVFIGWGMIYLWDFSFDIAVAPYALLFAVCYIAGSVGLIRALKYGPTTLTTLFLSLSNVVASIWGFIFWDAEITTAVMVGLILVCVSMYLCLYTKNKETKSVSYKWLLFMAITCFGNAGCGIVQRTQQLCFDGRHGSMLMMFAAGISVLYVFLMHCKNRKTNTSAVPRKIWLFPIFAGACNVLLNLFNIMMVQTSLSTSLIYPATGAGGLMVVTVYSIFAFQERLNWWQWIGMAIGTVATILLSA